MTRGLNCLVRGVHHNRVVQILMKSGRTHEGYQRDEGSYVYGSIDLQSLIPCQCVDGLRGLDLSRLISFISVIQAGVCFQTSSCP